MSNQTVEEEIAESEERTKQCIRQYVQLSIETEANRRIKTLVKEPYYQNNNQTSATSFTSDPFATSSNIYEDQQEPSEVYLDGYIESIATFALRMRKEYHNLAACSKSDVSLGLNSILDIDCFPIDLEEESAQINASKRYKINKYDQLLEPLKAIGSIYDNKKTADENWSNLHKEVKKYISNTHNDIRFCARLFIQILNIIKYESPLVEGEIRYSEWDHVVKFWSAVMERLFKYTELGLTRDDAYLTISDMFLKETCIEERKENTFDYLGPFEEEYQNHTFIRHFSRRSKVLLKSKSAIDNFLQNGCLIYSVDSLQFKSFELNIINTTLAEPGVYTGSTFYKIQIKKYLCDFGEYITLASQLLCFRDRCIEIYKQYETHLKSKRTSDVSGKRSCQDSPNNDLIYRKSLICESWYPPRTSSTPPPPPPDKLFGRAW